MRGKGRNVIPSMFISVAFAMILTQVMSVLAIIVDGMITSQFLGPFHYSAVSLLTPVISFLLLVTASTSTGCQIVCAKAVGVGNRDEANAAFTYSLTFSLVMAAFILIICGFFPVLLFKVTGVSSSIHKNLYGHMLSYLHGYMPGIPFLIVNHIVSPIVVLDGGKNRFTISSLTFLLTDITADFLNIYVFKGDIMGMGLASSFSFFVQFLILVSHFISKKSYFRLSFKNIKRSVISDVGKASNPTTVRKLFTTLRDLVINRINLSVAISAAAIAARGMQSDLNTLMFCIGLGIGNALLSMTSIYYSAQDRKGLRTLFSFSMKYALSFSGFACLVLVVFAPVIARSYTNEADVLELSIFSIRAMALALPLDTIATAFQSYLQGIRNRKLVNGISFFERFAIPVLSAMFLARIFGSKGVLASLAISKLVLILIMVLIILAKNRRFPRTIYDWMLIPKSFGGSEEDNLYIRIKTMEDVVKARDESEKFCLEHGIDEKRALYSALFIEEMAGNVVLHGKKKRFNSVCCDFRLFINDNKISITLRDYCRHFDPDKYAEMHQAEEAEVKGLGIKMVKSLSSEFRYFSAFDSNNLIIVLE